MSDFFFLAAGFGKRMGEWTKTTPKPLLQLDGISFLDYSLFLAHCWGAKRGWINVHYLGEQIVSHLSNFHAFPLSISFETDKILGTAGGIKTALADRSDISILILFNPDTLLFPNKTFHIREDLPSGSKAHLYLSKLLPGDNYTKIDLKADDRLDLGSGDYYYIGLALINPIILEGVPMKTYADLSTILKELAKKGELTGEIFDGQTLDLGEKNLYESYLTKNVFLDLKPEISAFISKNMT
jgi:MurNAc alpha-1-phosphate uridylyltransferase